MRRLSDCCKKAVTPVALWLSLCIFAMTAFSCNTEHSRDILLEWHNGKPVYAAIPFQIIQDSEEDFIPHGLKVTRYHNTEPLPGEIHVAGNHVRFVPASPFDRGQNYAVYYHDKLLGEFNVPAVKGNSK